MNMSIMRNTFDKDGIFGEMKSDDGSFSCLTLEHAYKSNDSFYPKVPEGTYLCVRGNHRLESMDKEFVTFELQDVPRCIGILIHCGNKNEDSSGCILIAKNWGNRSDGGKMICDSKSSFQEFIKLQDGNDQFFLTIRR